MKRAQLRIGSAAVLLWVIGCGSSVQLDDDGDGGSGNSGGTGGTGGIAGKCDAFRDAPDGDAVTIRFRNESGLNVYIPGTCDDVALNLDPVAGPLERPAYWFDRSCLQTCEDLQSEGRFECDACAPSVFLIPPGGTIETRWTGTGLAPSAMPAECFEYPEEASSCSAISAAPSGDYAVSATGFDSCPGCECDGENGRCFGNASGLQAFSDSKVFSYPSANMIEVVFGVCAFGCAEN
jgi:hypothetical protein